MTKREILALGFFDGVHLGHTALLRAARTLAEDANATAAVMTFDMHPLRRLTGQRTPLLNSAADRVELIGSVSGIREVFFLPFTAETAATPWQDFLDTLTRERHAAGYVVGYDFRFGDKGEGDTEKLSAYCAAHALSCRVISPVTLDGTLVSSTRIRALLSAGRVAEAVRFLGHPHLLRGRAQQGLLPWGEDVLPLPVGRYRASVDGGKEGLISVVSSGVELEDGAHRVEFIGEELS